MNSINQLQHRVLNVMEFKKDLGLQEFTTLLVNAFSFLYSVKHLQFFF